MLSEHEEIEAKLEADNVNRDNFESWIWGRYKVMRLFRGGGPDTYYENAAGAVVRHRVAGDRNRHELTVKKRQSEVSTRSRVEVDLHFGKRTQPESVEAFLEATGYERRLQLMQDATVFWIQEIGVRGAVPLAVSIYDVWKVKAPIKSRRRFIEIEAEKGADTLRSIALSAVEEVVAIVRHEFGLGEPLNQSLWELYTGSMYQLA